MFRINTTLDVRLRFCDANIFVWNDNIMFNNNNNNNNS